MHESENSGERTKHERPEVVSKKKILLCRQPFGGVANTPKSRRRATEVTIRPDRIERQPAPAISMIEHPPNTTHSTRELDQPVTDPAALGERQEIPFERRTYEHDDPEHCETEAVGRAIVGLCNSNGEVLVIAHPEEGQAVLPNKTVETNEDWKTIGRERTEAMAGIDVTLTDIRLVREVNHRIDGERRSRTHHVVFGASPVDSDASLDGLCDDNPWELRWIDTVPDWLPDDDPQGAHADIRLFLEDEK